MNQFVEKILAGYENLSVIGLGYVGLPIAIAFGKKIQVIGFDISEEKVQRLRKGIDVTKEISAKELKETSVFFTSDPQEIRRAKFHIVAVPTPIHKDLTPNLDYVRVASQMVGQNLVKGSIVVFESTVYPGLTEEICIPILESESGLVHGKDFKVGYSPERINPGDKEHKLETIVKLVSGTDDEVLDIIAQIYELVVKAGVHRTSTIKVAEAAKIIENTQRDLNIAFMNELSIIFHQMGIDTKEVLEAANTKWNFLNFEPGLVGGHCIGVDPYYLTHRAEQLGYHPDIILAGRKINDGLGGRIASEIVKSLSKRAKKMSEVRVGIYGFTFKADCTDIRNTRVVDIVNELKEYGISPLIFDPYADEVSVRDEYEISLVEEQEMERLDVLVIAVDHSLFKEKDYTYWLDKMIEPKIIFDVKGILHKDSVIEAGVNYWRL